MDQKRIAIIGAGTAGLCAAKHAHDNGMNVTVFEQASEIGGTWVYTDEVGKDKYGIDVHSSMYKGLHTNLPKEIMGYPDFPIPEQEKSYIPSGDMLKFLNLYATEFNIMEKIKFLHYVIRIRPHNDEWEIIVRNLPNNELHTYYFDYVMVCNGHYHTPAYPHIPGKKLFERKQMHSHDYRCPSTFVNENVLVIGAGPSGMDIAYEIAKYANRVTLSHHLKDKPKTIFPLNVTQKSDVLSITKTGAIFTDGTNEDYTVILYCTGFKYTFPFLSVDCSIYVDDNYVQPLYKHCLNINYPTMAFIGLPFYVCACQMFDLQVRFAIQYFSGKLSLPTREEMIIDTEREMQERWDKGYKKRQAHMMGPEQENYYKDLSETAGIENLKPVITKLHNESSQRFLDDLINFRKDVFRIIDDETFIQVN